jgi:hypothetical protein
MCTLDRASDLEEVAMSLSTVSLMLLLAVAPGDATPLVVQASGSPVQLDHARVLTSPDVPPVLLYGATNVSDESLDQFTVIVFVFDAQGKLKARQTAPARRTLEAHSTKYSTIVLDGSPIEPTDLIVVGVNQAQRVNSDAWWRADLQAAATEEAAKRKKP